MSSLEETLSKMYIEGVNFVQIKRRIVELEGKKLEIQIEMDVLNSLLSACKGLNDLGKEKLLNKVKEF